MSDAATPSEHVYRTDKFAVPAPARAEFLKNALETHALLTTQPGFVQGFILEQSDGPSTFNFVNFVEFSSLEAATRARGAVTAERTGFDPQAFQARLGIRADVGLYRQPNLD